MKISMLLFAKDLLSFTIEMIELLMLDCAGLGTNLDNFELIIIRVIYNTFDIFFVIQKITCDIISVLPGSCKLKT